MHLKDQLFNRLLNTEKGVVVTKGERLRQVVVEGEWDKGAQ